MVLVDSFFCRPEEQVMWFSFSKRNGLWLNVLVVGRTRAKETADDGEINIDCIFVLPLVCMSIMNDSSSNQPSPHAKFSLDCGINWSLPLWKAPAFSRAERDLMG